MLYTYTHLYSPTHTHHLYIPTLHIQGATITPYLDSKCLEEGEPWQEGFSAALCTSAMFVPLLSVHPGRQSTAILYYYR
jgi:hypothetical protein